MDRELIRNFWRGQAATGHTRWTQAAFLDHECELLGPLIGARASILDLGSGFGELSRSICPPDGRLVAVDQEASFASAFTEDERFTFVRSDVEAFGTEDRFDLILLFGVVTHLSDSEELEVYRQMARLLRPGGTAVVKNQCADSRTFEIDKFSETLGTRYVGRYPSVGDQTAALSVVFEEVTMEPYPPELKVHSDSSHVAFLCRSPRPANRDEACSRT